MSDLALADPAILGGESLVGQYVRIGLTGDGRPAVIERASEEPVQYLARTSHPKKLLAQWDETFRLCAARLSHGR